MKYIKLGSVRAFPRVAPDKAQALKVLEEASETVEAFKKWLDEHFRCRASWCHDGDGDEIAMREVLMDEIADTIQACCNLAAALGVEDMTPYLARCEERNRKRGRYDKEQQCK